MPFKKLLTTISLVFICAVTYAQDTKYYFKTRADSINILLVKIRQCRLFQPRFTGAAGIPSTQYSRFAFLVELSTTDDLIKFTSDNTPCVRLYAFAGLAYKRYDKLDEVKQILLQDSSHLGFTIGCTSYDKTVKNILGSEDIEHFYEGRKNTPLLSSLYRDPALDKAIWESILD